MQPIARAAQTGAVVFAAQAEGGCQARRAAGQIPVFARRRPATASQVQAFDDFPGPQEDRARDARTPAYDVDAVVHPVGEVDVDRPRCLEHRRVAGRTPAEGVRSGVCLPAVGLHFAQSHADGPLGGRDGERRAQQAGGDHARVVFQKPEKVGRGHRRHSTTDDPPPGASPIPTGERAPPRGRAVADTYPEAPPESWTGSGESERQPPVHSARKPKPDPPRRRSGPAESRPGPLSFAFREASPAVRLRRHRSCGLGGRRRPRRRQRPSRARRRRAGARPHRSWAASAWA